MTRIPTSPPQNAAAQRPRRLTFIIFLIMRPLAQNTSERTPLSGQVCVATPEVALSMPFPLLRKLHSCLDTTSDSILSPFLSRALKTCPPSRQSSQRADTAVLEKDEREKKHRPILFSLFHAHSSSLITPTKLTELLLH